MRSAGVLVRAGDPLQAMSDPAPIQFRSVPWEVVNWDELEQYPDRTLFQSRDWLQFLAQTQQAQPVVLALERGDETVGYFTCLIARRAGLRIAGSPFRGWTTSYLGFNTRDEGVRDEALRQLSAFAFTTLGCVHVEVMDRQVDVGRARSLGLGFKGAPTFEVDLAPAESEILARMHSSVRRYLRRPATRGNLTIEEGYDPSFAADYYAQLREVFARDSLVPSYNLKRVQTLIECLLPTGNLLLLRARNRAGRCVATGIFPARNGTMHFWGGASHRDSLAEHPNEPLHWHAMRYWKQRGMTCYDMGGGGDYKEKYGGVRKELAWIRVSRNRLIGILRDLAFHAFKVAQRFRAWHGSPVTR